MRILADENISRAIVVAVESLGHTVSWIARDRPGIPDSEVAALALAKFDVLVTFDKNLAADVAKRKSCSVVLVRLGAVAPIRAAEIVLHMLHSQQKLAEAFIVVSENGIRVRPFSR